MFDVVVWGTDGSENCDCALDYVRGLAEGGGRRVVAVHVNELTVGRSAGYPVNADEDEIQAKITRQAGDLQAAGIETKLEVASTATGGAAHVIARGRRRRGRCHSRRLARTGPAPRPPPRKRGAPAAPRRQGPRPGGSANGARRRVAQDVSGRLGRPSGRPCAWRPRLRAGSRHASGVRSQRATDLSSAWSSRETTETPWRLDSPSRTPSPTTANRWRRSARSEPTPSSSSAAAASTASGQSEASASAWPIGPPCSVLVVRDKPARGRSLTP